MVVLAVAVVVAMWRGGSGGGVVGGCGGRGGGGVEVAVAGGVPFGHPHPPKMPTIILITLSDKVAVLKKKLLSIILCYCTLITTTTPLLPFVTLPPLHTLYPFHLMLIVVSLLFCS